MAATGEKPQFKQVRIRELCLEGSIEEVIAYLISIKAEYEETEFRDLSLILGEGEYSNVKGFFLIGSRLETAKELLLRVKAENRREANERRHYESLKKKFEK